MTAIVLRPDGPHSDDGIGQVAEVFAETVRVLNHATRTDGALTEPQTVCTVTSNLAAGAHGLGQLLGQLAAFLHGQAAAGLLAADTSTPQEAVRHIRRRLAEAHQGAATLARALDAAHTTASGLYVPDPTDHPDIPPGPRPAEGCPEPFPEERNS